MAHAVVSSPMLRMKRSAQSGDKTMTAAWQVVYTESCTMAYIFAGAEISLANMIAGDTVDIRIRKTIISGGAWVNHDQIQYADAQPAGHPSVHVHPIPDTYGVSIEMRQVAGALINCEGEFFDAKRIGLT